jgi:hypothetical protein
MKSLSKLVATFCIAFSGLGLGTLSVQALTASDRSPIVGDGVGSSSTIETVRWVCPYYGNCYWVAEPRYNSGSYYYNYQRPSRRHYGNGTYGRSYY